MLTLRHYLSPANVQFPLLASDPFDLFQSAYQSILPSSCSSSKPSRLSRILVAQYEGTAEWSCMLQDLLDVSDCKLRPPSDVQLNVGKGGRIGRLRLQRFDRLTVCVSVLEDCPL